MPFYHVGPTAQADISLHVVLETADNGWPSNTQFHNNIFYMDGEADFEFGDSAANVFENNAFYGNFRNLPEGP